MTSLNLWERVKLGSKSGFERSWKAFDRPRSSNRPHSVNRLSAEAFYPADLETECEKSARILKSFCIDGFYADEPLPDSSGTSQAQRLLKRIPASVIRDAKALAIFTTVRNGLWLSGAGGSGVLIAQKDDGSWSPPSAILVHTAALGFVPGADVYDCVVVIDTQEALEAFYNVRYTLGSNVRVEAGPIINIGALELPMPKRHAPITTYMKSRGTYAGVHIDGTIIVERADENDNFYGQRLSVGEILNGRLQHPPSDLRRLLQTIKAAQGDSSYNAYYIPSAPPPGDYEVANGQMFGLPDKMDPDPYGVLALEKEGMGIVEAGSKQRASWDQLSFCPSPTSPVHSIYARSSVDTGISFNGRSSSWRGSTTSNAGQTFIRPNTLRKSTDSRLKISTPAQHHKPNRSLDEGWSPSILTWRNGLDRQSSRTSTTPSMQPVRVPRDSVMEDDYHIKDASIAPTPYLTPPSTPPSELEQSPVSPRHTLPDADYSEPKHGVQVLGSSAAPIVAKATLVDIPKRTKSPTHELNWPLPNDLSMHTPPSDQANLSDDEVRPQITQPQITDSVVAALLASEGKTVQDGVIPVYEAVAGSEVGRSMSKSSNPSSTWEKIRAFRAIDDYD